jgi:hypothetical protein
MKTAFITLTCAVALTAASCGSDTEHKTDTVTTTTDTAATAATVEPAGQPAPPMDSAAMAKAWMEYATPGDMHKWMASTDGVWTGEVKSWMAPDAPPTTNTATMTNKTILGGRYQQSTFKSTMEGQPFEGMGTIAYDNSKKKWVSTWVDNMGTGMVIMEGDMDQATKTMNMSGKMTDPMTGKDCKMREVITFTDDKTQKMEMYSDQGGGEMKVMEMVLTKK